MAEPPSKKRSIVEVLSSSITAFSNSLKQLNRHQALRWRKPAHQAAAGQRGSSKQTDDFDNKSQGFLQTISNISLINSKMGCSRWDDWQLQRLTRSAYAFVKGFLTAHFPINPSDNAVGTNAVNESVYLRGLECMRLACTGLKGAAPAFDWAPAWTYSLIGALALPLGPVVHDKVLEVLLDVVDSNKKLHWEDASTAASESLLRLCSRPVAAAGAQTHSSADAAAQFLQDSPPELQPDDVSTAMRLLGAMSALLTAGVPPEQSAQAHAHMETTLAVSWELMCKHPGQDGVNMAALANMYEQMLRSQGATSLLQPARILLVDFLQTKLWIDQQGRITGFWPILQLASLATLTEALALHLPAGRTPYWTLWLPMQRDVCAQLQAGLVGIDMKQDEEAVGSAFALLEKSSHACAQAHAPFGTQLPQDLEQTISHLEQRSASWSTRVRTLKDSLQALGMVAGVKRRRVRDAKAWAKLAMG